jgi:hypothetical protein
MLVLAAVTAAVALQRAGTPQSSPPSPQASAPPSLAVPDVVAPDAAVPPPTGETAPAPAPPRSAAGGPAAAEAGTEAAGLRAYIDPETGRFVPEPPPGVVDEVDRATAAALSTRSEDLVEQPSPVPGGGVMVELEGRFQSAIEMSVDESGALSSDCATDEAPPAADGNEGVRR